MKNALERRKIRVGFHHAFVVSGTKICIFFKQNLSIPDNVKLELQRRFVEKDDIDVTGIAERYPPPARVSQKGTGLQCQDEPVLKLLEMKKLFPGFFASIFSVTFGSAERNCDELTFTHISSSLQQVSASSHSDV